MKSLVIICALVLCIGEARASVASCKGKPDGVPCVNGCMSGSCSRGSCALNAPAPQGTPCTTGLYCTVDDVCDGEGTCTAGGALDCDDGDACTTDVCEPRTGCVHSSTCVADPPPGVTVPEPSGNVPTGSGTSDLGVYEGGGGCRIGTRGTDPKACLLIFAAIFLLRRRCPK